MVSGYIHAPAALLVDMGSQYPVYGGLQGSHINSRHDVLTVSFMWLDVSYTFPCPPLVMLLGRGGGAFGITFNHTSGYKR